MAKIDANAFRLLGQKVKPPPPPAKVVDEVKPWHPDLNPAQQKAWDSHSKFLLLHGPKGGSKCRTGDAAIYTANGLRRLRAMKPAGASVGMNPIEQPVLAFDGENVIPATAAGFWVEDRRDALKCELANGAELTGSPRHPLWVCAQAPIGTYEFRYASLSEMLAGREDGWRYWTPLIRHPNWSQTTRRVVRVEKRPESCRLCGKKASSRGLCDNHYQNENYHGRLSEHSLMDPWDIEITEDLAYFIGALVGDGSLAIGDGRCVGFSNTDDECLRRAERRASELGCKIKKDKLLRCEHSVIPAPRIKPLVRALKLDCLSYFKSVPDEIIESPKMVVAAFLRGLFDTDGTAEKYGGVSFTTVSEKLGREVQDLLATFGILAARRPRKSASGRPTWCVSMNGEHAEKFGAEIGFEIARKQARVAKPKFSKRRPHGFNPNTYGYPDPIRGVCRDVWKSAPISKSRLECEKHKRLTSWGSVPGRHKVAKIMELCGGDERFAPFLLANNWLEIVNLTPVQAELFDLSVPGPASFLASGTINHNTFGAVMKLVRHCYENQNALALILVKTQNMAKKGGAWDKLLSEIIPIWKRELGIQFSDVKTDQQHYQFIWIENQHGTWSMLAVMSCPHAHQLRERVRGMEPSMVFVDELTSCASHEYFQSVAAQLARRPGVTGLQQYIAACNPDGPSHWVYQQWFVTPFDEETGEIDADYEQIFFPREENRHRLQPGYFEHLKKVYKGDKTESARMEEGEWVDRPSGESLFAEIFHVVIHVRPITEDGKPDPRERLRPHVDYPIIISLDPGSVYNAFIFEQYVRVGDVMKWVIFDELVSIRKRISYPDFIPMVMRRVKWWREEVSANMPQVWISDNSAFNQYRAAQGSYDVLEIEKIYEMNRHKYKLEGLKVKQCPKFNGSVVARVQLAQKTLAEETVVVSSGCPHVVRMFYNLSGKKPKAGEPLDPQTLLTPQRSDFVHVFDAMTYAWLMASISPTALIPIKTSDQALISAAA